MDIREKMKKQLEEKKEQIRRQEESKGKEKEDILKKGLETIDSNEDLDENEKESIKEFVKGSIVIGEEILEKTGKLEVGDTVIYKEEKPNIEEEVTDLIPEVTNKSYEVTGSKPNSTVTVESTGVIESIVITAESRKALNAFRERRRAITKTVLVPLPISNAYIIGYPLSSSTILEGMNLQGEEDNEYAVLSRTLEIMADYISIQGIGKVEGSELASCIAYLDAPSLYYALYAATTDGNTPINLPCANSECVNFRKPFETILKNEDLILPDDPEKYMESVDAIKSSRNIVEMMKNSSMNKVIKRTFKDGTIVHIKNPSIADYMNRVIIHITKSNYIYKDILAISPFVNKIQIFDEENNRYLELNSFDEIFEQLLKYTSDEDLIDISKDVEEMIKGYSIVYAAPKDKIVCPHCGKAYPKDIPLDPRQLLFQYPARTK